MTGINIQPLILAAILMILICILTILRIGNPGPWHDGLLNLDIVFSCIYAAWIIYESKTSIAEFSKGNKTSDRGTCGLYALGQAGVFLSALWFDSAWQSPSIFHFLGLAVFVSGIVFRIWAVRTLGRFYSHLVRRVEGHAIVDSGPYRYLRHPAYAGMVLANAGIVLYYLNPVTVLVFLLFFLPAIILRIIIEEKTLFEIEGYPEFAESRKRLIPALW